MTLRIMDEYFQELITGIRECDDPEEISVEVCDAEGNSIVYQGGCLYIVSQDMSLRVPLDQLPPFQRLALEQVLVERVERIVDSIVSGAINVD